MGFAAGGVGTGDFATIGRGGAPNGSAGINEELCGPNEIGGAGGGGVWLACDIGKTGDAGALAGGNFGIEIGAAGDSVGCGGCGAAAGGGGNGTDEMEPRAGVAGAGAIWRGEAGATGFALFPTEKTNPSPFPSNGLVMSDGTSTLFCACRRTNKPGFSCERISLSGSVTAIRSLSASGVKA